MVWNIGLIGNDYKILKNSINSTTYGSSGSSVFSDYFTITESGNVGINNGTPKRKLDVNGDIFNNGTLISSNILGYATNSNNNTSNYLLINYNSNVNNSRNNILEIYGNSLFRGNVGIGTLTPKTTLDVNGSITASQFIGTGSNIFNINASNINAGTLNALPFKSFHGDAQGISFLGISSNISTTLIRHLPSFLGSSLSSTIPI